MRCHGAGARRCFPRASGREILRGPDLASPATPSPWTGTEFIVSPAFFLPLLLAATANTTPDGAPPPILSEPVLLTVAGSPLAGSRLFPSPAAHDFDGDGRPELAIGDLWGRITIAHRTAGGTATEWSDQGPLLGRDGKQLDFSNW